MNEESTGLELTPLDPAQGDPGYWARFHARVMRGARMELARRRREVEWSVAEVVFAWRRTLIPLSLLAAALAGFLLFHGGVPLDPLSPTPLEEALLEDLNGDPIPVVLGVGIGGEEAVFLASFGRF